MFQSVTSGSKSADLPSSFSLSKDEKAYDGNPSLTAEKITCSENGLVPARGPRGSRKGDPGRRSPERSPV